MTKDNNIEKQRHSLSHIMAIAVKKLWPEVKFAIGPAIDNGFYYDFDFGKNSVGEEDLKKIEKEMKHIVSQNLEFTRTEMGIDEALKKEQANGQPYKVELIEDLKTGGETKVSYYHSGGFEDLCAGPHLESAKSIAKGSFKLTKLAGAYWRGDEKNKMLTRIYGVAFETKKELDDYLAMLVEAEKRDHRKLGKELGLFVFSDVVGKGLPLWTKKGSIVRMTLERFIVEEETKRGYEHVYTPDIAKIDLYKKSGHYPYYKDSMYPPLKIDNEEFMLRPMTCPHHFELYLSKPRSYKELPMRIAELAKLYRYEQSGELTGLIRIRSFCLADAHIICADKESAGDEIDKALELIEYLAKIFGLKMGDDYWYRLSLGNRKDEKKYFKDDKAWDDAESILRKVLTKRKADFVEAEDEAAFYGPKIDVQMKNFRGKEDTAFTVQYDFVMSGRFNLVYTDKNGKEKLTVVVHRSSIGAVERTIAFLIERYAGAFPVWLSPVQVKLIAVGENHVKFCEELADEFRSSDIRVEVDNSNETVGNKIRKAVKEKDPYMLVIGDKEMGSDNLMVRDRGRVEVREIAKDDFIKEIKEKVKTHVID
ncbi:MAG: threonine--tRNA ligase [bacterium]|nr:threonine--tRNA ligase [bacterium]